MPITAYREAVAIVSTELSAAEFDALRGTALTFRCGVRAIPRRSKAGLPHFYHQSLADCGFPHTNPETDEHRAMKSAIIRGALAAGWAAEEEYPNDDRSWIADVMVTRGQRRIAFEAQWSKQDDAQFRFRTDRYRQARMETVWFYRHAAATDMPRHGLIPVRKRDDGAIVTVGPEDQEGLTVEAAVIAILTRSAWWKFAREDVAETLVTEWSVVPCLGCGATNVSALRAERVAGCGRCQRSASRRVTAAAVEVLAAASDAGVGGTVLMTGTTCGGCAREMGSWAIEVGATVAAFTRSSAVAGTLKAHWCVPGHDVASYADVTTALTAAPAVRPRVAPAHTTAASTVRKNVAEVLRRLEKAAHTNQKAREKKEFMASPAGKEWLKKRRAEESAKNMTELMASRLPLEDDDGPRFVAHAPQAFVSGPMRAAIHERTMTMRDESQKGGTTAAALAARFGPLLGRCPCADCEKFRGGLSERAVDILFVY